MFKIHQIIRKLKVLAKSKKALYALAVVCFLEPIILPLYPEVLLAPLLLTRSNQKMSILLLAIMMTLLGSVSAYCLSYFFGHFLLSIIGKVIANLDLVIQNMTKYGSLLPFLGSLTPMPFKVVCLCSGLIRINFYQFILGVSIGRAMRYSLLLLIPQKKSTQNATKKENSLSCENPAQ